MNKRKRELDDPKTVKKLKQNSVLQFPCEREIGHGWSVQIRNLEKSDANCIPDLFDSIQDFLDFITYEPNAVVGLIKDEYKVWRGGFVGYFYEKPAVIKLPLFATSLHFRRQGLGRLLLAYLREQSNEKTSIVALAMEDETAFKFWES